MFVLEWARVRLGLLPCSFGRRSQLLARCPWASAGSCLLLRISSFGTGQGGTQAAAMPGFRVQREAGAAPWLWHRRGWWGGAASQGCGDG